MHRILFTSLLIFGTACDGGGGPTVPGGGATGTVRGEINDNTGVAVPNATVTLTGNGQALRTTTTNTTGVFVFNTVAVGSYTVAVTPPTGFTLAGAGTAAVTVTSGQQANVNTFVFNRITGGGGNAPAFADVSMVNTSFQPQQVEVAVGGTVRFTNNDNTAHNATGQGGIQTGNLNAGQVSDRVMTTAGTFAYACTLHAGMNGTVVVR